MFSSDSRYKLSNKKNRSKKSFLYGSYHSSKVTNHLVVRKKKFSERVNSSSEFSVAKKFFEELNQFSELDFSSSDYNLFATKIQTISVVQRNATIQHLVEDTY